MNELSKLLQENLNIEFISATLSNPKNKDGVQKVKVRPILKKDVLYFQLESFRNNQAFHENVEEKKACEILLKYMENMRQMQMETQRAAYTILVSKKGKVTIKSKMKKGEKKQIDSKMVCIGADQTYTAMAKTVGLPVAMATLLILNGKIRTPGVQLPIRKEVYLPILQELEEYGVVFKEQEMPYLGYNQDKVFN